VVPLTTDKPFMIIGVGVHTIDYRTSGFPPTLEEGANLSITAPMRASPGGIGNGIPVAAKLFPGKVGAATLLAHDPNGEAFFNRMVAAGVDVGGIKWNTDLPDKPYEVVGASGDVIQVNRCELSTGMSFICLDPRSGFDPLIFFSPGTNQVISRENLDLNYLSRAKAVIISYSTLLRDLDRNHGEPMAALIRDLKARDVDLTALDTHSIKGADYSALDLPLREVDIFGCNTGEAKSITWWRGDTYMPTLLKSLSEKMDIRGDRSRLLVVSMKGEGCAVAYFRPGVDEPVTVHAPACKVKVVDGTGAGDSLKVGIVAYVVENLGLFKAGKLDVMEAVRFGNATAASYISGVGTENVGSFQQTLEFMRSQYPERVGSETLGQPPGVVRSDTQFRPPVDRNR